MKSLGKHLLIEFFACDEEILADADLVEKAMNEAALAANATIINSVFHRFTPYGVSGAVIIAESHLTIHTWPEYGYAAVDVFTCGEEVDPYNAYKYLKKAFLSQNDKIIEAKRGELAIDNLRVKPMEN